MAGDALNVRDRSVAVITALVTQQVVDDRLTPYLGIVRRSGVTEEELETLMMLLAFYLGQPVTSLGAAAALRTRSKG